jgi:hypothetical protein
MKITPLKELFDCLFPKDRIITVLKSYFDESGKLQDPKIEAVAVAGFLSTPKKWSSFEKQWKPKLKKYGIKKGFHMADCENGKEEFEGWTEQRKSDLINELIPIIKNCALFGVGAAMTTEDYIELTRKRSKGCSPYVEDPYYGSSIYCFYTLVLEMRKKFPNKKASIIFDETDKEMEHRAIDYYKWFKDTYEGGNKLVDLSYMSDIDAVPLQAADFLAYETRKQAISKVYSQHRPNWLWNLQFKRDFLFGGYLDREHLKPMIDILRSKGQF